MTATTDVFGERSVQRASAVYVSADCVRWWLPVTDIEQSAAISRTINHGPSNTNAVFIYIYILYVYTSDIRRLVKFLRELLLSPSLYLSLTLSTGPTVQVPSYIRAYIHAGCQSFGQARAVWQTLVHAAPRLAGLRVTDARVVSFICRWRISRANSIFAVVAVVATTVNPRPKLIAAHCPGIRQINLAINEKTRVQYDILLLYICV